MLVECESGCGNEAEYKCSGLDVPELAFCRECIVQHRAVCPHILDGSAWTSRFASHTAGCSANYRHVRSCDCSGERAKEEA